MSDQPKIKIDTDKELSPETREMLERTPEQDVLTDDEQPTQPSSSLRIPVPSQSISDVHEG